MDKFVIEGGRPLRGTVTAQGSKNACLPMMAAALLADGETTLRNVPRLSDIETMAGVLRALGATVEWDGRHVLAVDTRGVNKYVAPYDLVRRMRASIAVLGPLVGRFRRAEVSLPGGCAFGPRPVDLHIKAIRELGAAVELKGGYIVARAAVLKGKRVNLSGPAGPSRGATANLMMAAALADGVTVIEDAAREPETVDLVNMLNAMGARIEGAGSAEITVTGVGGLEPCEYDVMADQIEAATYLLAGAITGGDVTVEGADAEYLGLFSEKMREAGVALEVSDGGLTARSALPVAPLEIRTGPYPDFPTDLQPQMTALLSLASGRSVVVEGIYPDRFNHAPELIRLGAHLEVTPPTAVINGVHRLYGAFVMAADLRAGAALVLAGLAAEGETNVRRVYHVDRGYEGLEDKLTSLGASIRRVEEE
ncbi:MAG TPA: UDP-N-acetylglucosamine 1-carboxyvinyltransferase [bacterium]|nr:UDP-N-acetylglucosamine 1-carboxyvinyltransferase [bacterium]